MFLSVVDVFKIGIGPSSSHTMGPMAAAGRFLALLRARGVAVDRLQCRLHGSLALTGRGHATDRAVLLGLAGLDAGTAAADRAGPVLARIGTELRVRPPGLPSIRFDPEQDIVFDTGPPLSDHPNGLVFTAFGADGQPCCREIYYSIGGGFVLTADELKRGDRPDPEGAPVPFPFRTAREMVAMSEASGLGIAAMKRSNELARMSAADLDAALVAIAEAMFDCIDRGLAGSGELPGGLGLRRRAGRLYAQLLDEQGRQDQGLCTGNDWLCAYAMAVNEENAVGGRVVTAPTNGAAGVFPAVLRFYLKHLPGAQSDKVSDMLLTGAAIGGMIKHNASISGAEVGCQGEVGSAAAMAAAALCEVRGGSARQVENAAEIALEHHLGMTCDPIKGLVQAPCIERNALGAVKAVAAASLALRGDGCHLVPLDSCIETMRQTGMDMHGRYKETSTGGLAVNLPEC